MKCRVVPVSELGNDWRADRHVFAESEKRAILLAQQDQVIAAAQQTIAAAEARKAHITQANRSVVDDLFMRPVTQRYVRTLQ